MKRTIAITVFFIVFLIIYFLQSNFFCWYNIAGIEPNIFIIFMLFIGLYAGKKYGFVVGVIFGFLLDLFIGKRIGLNGFMLGITGVLGGILARNYSQGNRITFILITAGITILVEMLSYILQIAVMHSQILFIKYISIIIIEAIYNSIITIILYPLIQKMGNIVGRIFNEKNNSFMKIY